MLLTRGDLKALSRRLDAERVRAVAGSELYCMTPLNDIEIKSRGGVPSGTEALRHTVRGQVREVQGPVVHGRAFLAIDSDTKEVVCEKCSGKD